MKYSIIVPIYNIEKYINKCIRSILDQSFSDFELILVDDGSTDNCPQICDFYANKDPRIIVLHKKNGGLVSARQAGINIATGDYSLYVDGDDWIDKEALYEINSVLNEYDVDVLCFGFNDVSPNGIRKIISESDFGFYDRNKIKKQILPQLIEDSKSHYFAHNAWGKVAKTQLFRHYQNLVNPKIVMCEDVALSVPLIANVKTLYISPKCLYYYNRLNESSITNKKKPLSWKMPFLLQEQLLSYKEFSRPFFINQIYRNTVHNLFSVAVSQFNSDQSYKYNKEIIKKNLSDINYSSAINNCSFDFFSKGNLAKIALKYRLIIFIYTFWRFK